MPSQGEQVVDHIAAKHDQRAVGQVDDVEHAPDQRHAERHEAVEPAQQHAVDENLQQKHGRPFRRARRIGGPGRRLVPAEPRRNRPLAGLVRAGGACPAGHSRYQRLFQAGIGYCGLFSIFVV